MIGTTRATPVAGWMIVRLRGGDTTDGQFHAHGKFYRDGDTIYRNIIGTTHWREFIYADEIVEFHTTH